MLKRLFRRAHKAGPPAIVTALIVLATGLAFAPAQAGGAVGVAAAPFSYITGRDATAPSSSWRKPNVFRPTVDPAYGLTVRRVTSADGTRFDRNTYSRRQAENADGTFIMTYHGSAAYRVYNVDSGRLLTTLDLHPDSEPQWHPTSAALVRHLSGDDASTGSLRLYETNVTTGITTVAADLGAALRTRLPGAAYLSDGAEGSPSKNGRRYAWKVFDSSEQWIGIVTYDVAAKTVLGVRTKRQIAAKEKLDAISMSPSGRWVIAQYHDGTYLYPANLTRQSKIYASADHSDIMIGRDGHDYYVYVDFSASANGGWVLAHDLDDGSVTRLFDLYDQANTSIHFSGKAYDNPGWVVASTYNCKVDGAWSCDKVFAVDVHFRPDRQPGPHLQLWRQLLD